VFGTVQRQVATKPVAGQAAQKKSRLVRIERYWRSPSARAFFDDGSNEEVTFVAASSLEPTSQPEGASEKVVDLTIDRSFPIRPHVEFATHSSGSKVKVVTRLSPADRISKLPASVRRELWEAFLSDPANESDPQMMEFIADMGEGLKETSSTTKIEEEGRDPVKLARMQAVDQWVGEQQSDLDKVGTRHRARFTQLLSDVRKVGVTGPVEAEDLGVQDIELVLAGAAGGQSEFQTFNEFKRVMEWKLRSGNNSLPEENADNPDLYIRNEYRKAWKAEAAGLRNMSRIAEAAQVAPFKLLAYSAAVGTGFAALEVAGAGLLRWAAGRGISHRLLVKWAGTSLLASSAVSHFVSARDEAKAAGMDPNSPSGIVNTGSVALLRTFGVGEVKENIENQSMLTGQPLNRSAFERITGGVLGAASAWGAFGTFVPEAPSVVPAPRGETPPPVTANEPPSPQEIKFPRVDVTEGKAFDVPLNPPTVPRQLEFPRVDVTQGKAFDVPLNPPAAPRQLEFPRIDVTQGKAFHAPEPPPQIAFPRVDVTHGQAFHAPEAPKSVKSLSEEIATLEKQRAQVGADAKKAWDEARPAKNKVKRNEPVSAQEQELIKKHDDLMAARDKLDAELTKKRAQRTQQSPRFRSKEHREVWVGREKQAEQVLKNIAGEGNVYVKPMIARPGTAKLPLETTPGSFSVRERTRLGLSANQVSPEFGVRLNDGSVVMVDMKGAGKHSWTKQKFIYEGLQRDGRGVVVVGRPGLPAGTVVEGKVVLLGPAELDELVASPTLETLMRLLGRSK
jgi:hypothetical protein